jgi:hypothetical protein
VVESFFENLPLHRLERRALEEGENRRIWCCTLIRGRRRDAGGVSVVPLDAPDRAGSVFIRGYQDEPPPEVATTGHDRCIIAIQSGWRRTDSAPRGSTKFSGISRARCTSIALRRGPYL